jgi:RimJ/RimL family protein N-acetyltransferase
MTDVALLRGPRVLLRPWQPADLDEFAALNADPAVMEFLPAALSREEAAAMMQRMQDRLAQQGWGHWCMQIDQRCAGFIGLSSPGFEAHFTPCVEIGWRLARWAWGKGYATEGARLAVAHGFDELRLPEIVSFTTVANLRSRRVMERLGMQHNPAEDFNHPRLPGHPLERHVLYRQWRGQAQKPLP